MPPATCVKSTEARRRGQERPRAMIQPMQSPALTRRQLLRGAAAGIATAAAGPGAGAAVAVQRGRLGPSTRVFPHGPLARDAIH